MESKNIQDHLGTFHNLMIFILQRRALFRIFENNLKNKNLDDGTVKGNSFVSFYITGYTREQLVDLRKFFETDDRSYKISGLVSYVGNLTLEAEYEALKKEWKKSFEVQVNKLIAHIDKDSAELVKEVAKQDIDSFIDLTNHFLDNVVNGLLGKGWLKIEGAFRDSAGEFLNKDQEDEFKEYLEWACCL